MSKNVIQIRDAVANNLKHVSIDIPLGKLVAIVGKSGSGKSSLVYDVIYRASQEQVVEATVKDIPKTFAIGQKVKPVGKMSLGETNFKRLNEVIREVEKGDLLIVDEPCAGMAVGDRKRVLELLRSVVAKGATVFMVEHNKDMIAGADHVIEFGPDSGAKGGEVIFQGPIEKFKKAKTSTASYVFSDKAAHIDYKRSPVEKALAMQKKWLTVKGVNKNNIKGKDVSFPLSSLVCVSGPMGSGKSTILSVVYGALFKGKNAWKLRQGFESIEGKTNVRRSYFVDQSLLSSVPTSTPATYLGIWESIRDAYAKLPESKRNKLSKTHFSFNTKMSGEVGRKVAQVLYRGRSISDVMQMTIDEAIALFSDNQLIARKLGLLQEVGLGYLELGQQSNTLSGGEAQRVRLAKILSKKLGDRCIYILDIPSRGLHLSDLPTLMRVLQKIIDKNNTVLIAENKEEVIRNCDHVIRL